MGITELEIISSEVFHWFEYDQLKNNPGKIY